MSPLTPGVCLGSWGLGKIYREVVIKIPVYSSASHTFFFFFWSPKDI